jgi:hypothetical protein
MTAQQNKGEKPMSNIRIECVKEVSSAGVEGYRVTGWSWGTGEIELSFIQALKRDELPAKPLQALKRDELPAKPLVYMDTNLYLRNYGDLWHLRMGDFYPCETMEKFLAHIAAAGQHLADVNAELKAKRAKWHGKIVFVDGKPQQAEYDLLSK